MKSTRYRSTFLNLPEDRVPESDHPHALLDLLLLLVDDDGEHRRHELTQAQHDVDRNDGPQDGEAAWKNKENRSWDLWNISNSRTLLFTAFNLTKAENMAHSIQSSRWLDLPATVESLGKKSIFNSGIWCCGFCTCIWIETTTLAIKYSQSIPSKVSYLKPGVINNSLDGGESWIVVGGCFARKKRPARFYALRSVKRVKLRKEHTQQHWSSPRDPSSCLRWGDTPSWRPPCLPPSAARPSSWPTSFESCSRARETEKVDFNQSLQKKRIAAIETHLGAMQNSQTKTKMAAQKK